MILPIFTGGIWLERGKHLLEYTNPAPALLVMLAWLWWLNKKGYKWREGRVYRLAAWIWKKWESILGKHPRLFLLYFSFFIGGIWALASCRRHWNFNSGAADLGIFTNAIWHWSSGLGYICSVKDGMNLLADHQSYIFMLFGPIYRLFPQPELLLVVQGCALALGGGALFFLARAKGVAPKLCALLPLLYWAYAPTRNANAFDFHPEVLLLPLSLGFLWSIETSWRGGKFLAPFFFVLALGAKESAAPVFVGIALVLFLHRRRALALLLAAVSLTLFYINLKIVPGLFGAHYAYSDVYGGGPRILITNLFHFSRLKFLWGTLSPFAFLPLLSPVTFISALPGYAMLFFTGGDQRLSLGFHYSIEPSVGIFWALCAALTSGWVKARERKVFWILLIASLLCFGRSELFSIRRNAPDPHKEWLADVILPRMNPSASIAASSALVPHLANRDWIDALPEVQKPSGEVVDCIVHDASLNNTPMSDAEWNALNLFTRGYHEILHCGSTQLFEQQGKTCLSMEVHCER